MLNLAKVICKGDNHTLKGCYNLSGPVTGVPGVVAESVPGCQTAWAQISALPLPTGVIWVPGVIVMLGDLHAFYLSFSHLKMGT